MKIDAAIAAMLPELTEWRHALHSQPETAFAEHKTAALIARELKAMGLEVHEGIAGTGVTGVLRNGDGWSVGLRAGHCQVVCYRSSKVMVAWLSSHLGSLHKSDIIVRFARTNRELMRHREDHFSEVA